MMVVRLICVLISVLGLASATVPLGGMLAPQDNEVRQTKLLSGYWTFKPDPQCVGMSQKWFSAPLPAPTMVMPVPASYNDITEDPTLRDIIGWVWYEKVFYVPKSWAGERIVLRFESVHYYAAVYLDGVAVVDHYGGHLPFEADLTSLGKYGQGIRLTVAVNNTLSPVTLPPGEVQITGSGDPMHPKGYTVQNTYFDFFNYAGIHRDVLLYTTPLARIDDITVTYSITSGGDGVVHYNISVLPKCPPTSTIMLLDSTGRTSGNGTFSCQGSNIVGQISVEAKLVKLWSPASPYLYTLQIQTDVDVYRLASIGIRTIKVTSNQFLINNQPFYFHGVDKHEDSDIRGKGLDRPLVVKDFELLKWMHANAFRTSHYPYSEDWYNFADSTGVVIISEAPAVGMREDVFFSNATLQHHHDVMYEMIRRDKNHPSVVMWSVANEPFCHSALHTNYFASVVNFTRYLDPTRPVTLVASEGVTTDACGQLLDVVSVNRYFGWYSDSGVLSLVSYQLNYDMNQWYQKYGKPILMSEYGADTVPGLHKDPPVMFSEEFQVAFFEQYWSVFDDLRQKFFIGELVWNFADFETGQSIQRIDSLNFKGVFTRQRQPKFAATALKWRYEALTEELGH
eukprot:TRINITY_DN3332_c0_g1_i2.p1 TRINITY_DN3332_c0_g1~~TRINITY_DN3332_c0_g1_i2.p1  ORF type:complete len:623 (+),score=122.86 TRINITY_DN3332_c0_g1_i2:29-1897(+)